MANEIWEKIKSDVLRDAKQYIDDDVEYFADEEFDEDVIDILHDLFSTTDTEICERIIGQGIGGKEYLDTSLRCVALGCVMDDVIEHFHKVVKANKANEE